MPAIRPPNTHRTGAAAPPRPSGAARLDALAVSVKLSPMVGGMEDRILQAAIQVASVHGIGRLSVADVGPSRP